MFSPSSPYVGPDPRAWGQQVRQFESETVNAIL